MHYSPCGVKSLWERSAPPLLGYFSFDFEKVMVGRVAQDLLPVSIDKARWRGGGYYQGRIKAENL